MFKNLIVVLCSLGSISFIVEGMAESSPGRGESISGRSSVSLLKKEEKEFFKKTWDKKKSLVENQVNIVREFKQSCCDFSIKVQDIGLKGISLGVTAEGDEIIFMKKGTGFKENHFLNRVFLHNELDNGDGIYVNYFASIIPNIVPLDMKEWMIEEFDRHIQRFVDDSVGCEILRTAIAKYKANSEDKSKIIFIPVKDNKINLAYTKGSYVWKYMEKEKEKRLAYENSCKKRKMILFSPDWSGLDREGLIVKLNLDKVDISKGIIPRETELLYHLIYAINVADDKEYGKNCNKTDLIENISKGQYFYGDSNEIGRFRVLDKFLNLYIFQDDRSYFTMFGVSKKGMVSINESSYLAHKYGMMRATHLGSKSNLKINGSILSIKESYKLFKQYLLKFGDHELYKHYLSPSSTIKYPEFGKGEYKYSNS